MKIVKLGEWFINADHVVGFRQRGNEVQVTMSDGNYIHFEGDADDLARVLAGDAS